MSLAAHTIVKQIIDFAMAVFGCFSTVAQSLVATCLGKVELQREFLSCARMFTNYSDPAPLFVCRLYWTATTCKAAWLP